jgi:DNA-binding transcriptional MerR regulator
MAMTTKAQGWRKRQIANKQDENMTIEAMKQALEALENASPDQYPEGARVFYDAKDALRQAIEQAEKQGHEFVCGECVKCGTSIEKQEPVAWQDTQKTWVDVPLKNVLKEKREWVGLTDEQIETCYETTGHYQTLRPQDRFAVFALAKAIEAKLKQKNGYAEEKNK